MHELGATRSAHARDHLLQTPDTFIRTSLPCLRDGQAVVHVAPAAGAAFTQYTAEIEYGGELAGAGLERFVYVLEGELILHAGDTETTLATGGFAYVPDNVTHSFRTWQENTRAAVIERRYMPLPGVFDRPRAILTGKESDVPPTALMGDEALQVRTLLPADMAFDFAVNTMTYQPGASLSMVEIHVMEHGLLMLEGGGIYRLGERWYPVKAGDFIWMAPFCPQWFGALGKVPAKYLIYKDANRHPLEPSVPAAGDRA